MSMVNNSNRKKYNNDDIKEIDDKALRELFFNLIDAELIDLEFLQSSDFKSEKMYYRLELRFRFNELICQREIVVDSETTLDDLHTMIQAIGNWLNYHLHCFTFVLQGKTLRAEPPYQIEDESFETETNVVDSTKITLRKAFNEFPILLYEYDFGDGWEICITWLGISDSLPNKGVPYCLSGKGDWPPDDVGGEGGFLRFQQILSDKSDEEYEEMKEWGESQGFNKYSLSSTNSRLRHWQDYSVELY